jgi:hypothetical protein
MAEIDPNEPPLFDVDEIAEGDVEGDESKGGLTLEGVKIPFDILEHGNGRLPDSALERIGIGGHRLHRDAAAAFARFREAARGAGIDLTLTDSYRDFDEQVDLKRRKPGLSATPGKSVHGWGFAVDVSVGMPPKGFGQSVYSWLKANGPGLGWHLGRPKDEPWHWVYRGPVGATPPSDPGTEELVVGSSGDRVRQLQQCLQITADGDFGPQTEAAVKAFQQQCGLTVDGRVGPKTWAAVLAAATPAAAPAAAAEAAPVAAPVARPELVRGSSGEHVVFLQQRLGITADGKFGPQTEAAVKAFQQQHSLAVDGRVGPKTWAALGG